MYSGLKYLFQNTINCRSNNNELSGGLPHSEIRGSKPILGSSRHIAEYHVLHRLLLPRHSPNALFALDLIQKKTGLRLSRYEAGSARTILLFQKHTFPFLPIYRQEHWLVYLTWTTLLCFRRAPKNAREVCTHARKPKQVDCISLHDVKHVGKTNERPIGRLNTVCSAQ